jgi:hypothetical protein
MFVSRLFLSKTRDTVQSANRFVTIETGRRESGCAKHQAMARIRALTLAAACLSLGMWLLTLGPPVSAQRRSGGSPPMEVTTDTPEYCEKLLHRIGELLRLATAPVPHEASDLTNEGQKMCDHGQTRSGIMRLRSALMIMEKDDGPAYR